MESTASEGEQGIDETEETQATTTEKEELSIIDEDGINPTATSQESISTMWDEKTEACSDPEDSMKITRQPAVEASVKPYPSPPRHMVMSEEEDEEEERKEEIDLVEEAEMSQPPDPIKRPPGQSALAPEKPAKPANRQVAPTTTSSSAAPSSTLRRSRSVIDSFYETVGKMDELMSWKWTVRIPDESDTKNAGARVFYKRMIGEFNSKVIMLLETGANPNKNCAEMVLHIYDRLLLLFDSMCDANDDEAQDVFIDLTRDIIPRLYELARYAAHNDHSHYDEAKQRETAYIFSRLQQSQSEHLGAYRRYMKFLEVVSNDRDVEYLRNAILSPESAHKAYILPMASFCNSARNTGRPFPASNLAMLAVKICKIVDIACHESSQNTDRVLECCWDLFDSIVQGDLSDRESAILNEVRIVPAAPSASTASSSSSSPSLSSQPRPKRSPKLPSSPPPSLPPAPLKKDQESSGCTLQ